MIHSTGERKPNDPKLSHGRTWRAGCGGGKVAAVLIAACVTCAPVGCSAWLGVAVGLGECTAGLGLLGLILAFCCEVILIAVGIAAPAAVPPSLPIAVMERVSESWCPMKAFGADARSVLAVRADVAGGVVEVFGAEPVVSVNRIKLPQQSENGENT